jgi:hypothetical protein
MGTKTQKLSNVVDQIVEWQSVFTGDGSTGLTAVGGRGYFIDTTSGTVTVTLPASPKIGDIVQLKDYARTWNTNNVTIASTLLDGSTNANTFSTNGQTLTLVYMDGTKGWSLINEDTTTALGAQYVTATGGTVTTSGDFKIHTFTGDGCFVVSSVGNPAGGGTNVDYLVVAGGGGGAGAAPGSGGRGGGGAGGFRLSNSTCMPAPLTSPLAASCGITVSVTTYPVTVGAGGSGGTNACTPSGNGTKGSDSVFSTITSTGGGRGNAYPHPGSCTGGCSSQNGGSGGGGYNQPDQIMGAGNTPPVSPPQGNPSVRSITPTAGGSGGGGGGASNPTSISNPNSGLAGGIGSYVLGTGFAGCNGTTGPVGSTKYFAGGGGGGSYQPCGTQLSGGDGGGGDGGNGNAPFGTTCGTSNTGGGGGGGGGGASGGAGGKGIVILRYKFQN